MTRREAAQIAEEVVKQLKAQGFVEDKVLGVDEVAEILGVKKQTIYNHSKELPCATYGGKLRFFRSDVFKLLRQ